MVKALVRGPSGLTRLAEAQPANYGKDWGCKRSFFKKVVDAKEAFLTYEAVSMCLREERHRRCRREGRVEGRLTAHVTTMKGTDDIKNKVKSGQLEFQRARVTVRSSTLKRIAYSRGRLGWPVKPLESFAEDLRKED